MACQSQTNRSVSWADGHRRVRPSNPDGHAHAQMVDRSGTMGLTLASMTVRVEVRHGWGSDSGMVSWYQKTREMIVGRGREGGNE